MNLGKLMIKMLVASIPINEGDGGGDLHFMSVCSHDLISRIALADVSGHGREVDAAAMTLHELMRKNIHVWDQSDFMRGLNDTFNQNGAGQCATAIVLSFHLWLANCYFAVDSLGFPVLLPFRVAPSHRSFHSSVPCPACSHLAASVP
jgi:phosphoserine phosphatase RsbU/P